MSKRVTVIVVIVAAIGILSGVMIARQAGAPGSTDNLPDRTGSATPEGAYKTDKAPEVTDQAEPGRTALQTAATASKTAGRGRSQGVSIIENAAAAGKYTFIYFYSDEGDLTKSSRAVFRKALSRITEKAVPLEICTTDPAERQVVGMFRVDRAPMPLVLAIAPNGAVTGGFPQRFEESQLLDAFASPCQEKSLKALQERKVVLLCVQNGNTELNVDAMKGVRDFKSDPKFGPATEIVTLDPADPLESEFLRALQVAPQTHDAVTVCIVPPGQAVARFTGETTKETIVAALSSAGGCGPGGCGPSGCGK